MDTPTKRAPKPPTKKIHPQLPEALHARLVAYAARSHRSLNASVLVLLEEGLDRADQGRASQPIAG
jgi:predicted HicB family RNase H-like nuclease